MKQDKRYKTTTKEKALHRIRIIKGHPEAIEEMLTNDEYCVDIVHQSRAVQSALKKIDLLIIEEHLKTCVIHQIKNDEEKKTTDELLKLFAYK